MRAIVAVITAGGFSMSRSRISLSLLVFALCVVPASAEVFHVTLNNGSVIDTAYQPQQASWDPNMVLLLSDTGNWVGFPKEEIESIRAEDPTQGFGVRINDKTIALGLSPNDLPVPDESGRSQQLAQSDRYYDLAERALALAEKQQNYSIQQGVATEQTQGIPATFGGAYSGGSPFNGLSGGDFGGGGLAPGPVLPPDSSVTPPNPNG
ncbi:MAG TPA: hypothetical protein VHC97_22515 [Thermoanaerobaculia bacterium]|jgi:uncharacterized membrane protein YgcG|nr:hypothetical protein [Thermoanaerobaculia bacterium]